MPGNDSNVYSHASQRRNYTYLSMAGERSKCRNQQPDLDKQCKLLDHTDSNECTGDNDDQYRDTVSKHQFTDQFNMLRTKYHLYGNTNQWRSNTYVPVDGQW